MIKTLKPMSKKGFSINALLPIAMVFIVVGIAVSFGLSILGDVRSSFTSGTAEYNATTQTVQAVGKFPAKLGILATVVIAAILIGVLVRYLGGAGQGRA